MGDTTKQVDTTPPEIQQLRNMFAQYLRYPGSGNMGQTGATGTQPQNMFIGASQFSNPNTGAAPTNPNPITGQPSGQGPMAPPQGPWVPPPTTPPPTTQPPTGGTPTNPPPLPPTTVTPPPPPTPGNFGTVDLSNKVKPTATAPSFFTSLVAPTSPTTAPTASTTSPQPSSYDPNAWMGQQQLGGLTPTNDYAATLAQMANSPNWFTPGAAGEPGMYSSNPVDAQANGMLAADDPRRLTGGLFTSTPGPTPTNPTTNPFLPAPAPAPGGFGSLNPSTTSADVVTWPDGTQSDPMGVPPGTTPWQPGQPVDVPPGVLPPAQPGGGGPVAPGGPTGTGVNNPVYQDGTAPGSSAFDRMIAQLPPEMARIILGDPAMIDKLNQARESFTTPQTQSVDQLGGANSAFFQNMMAQLQPAFSQQRAEGLAAAKEASGNLTGSGYANALGSSINRSLGQEQATLANYASQGLQTEVQRQLQQAGIDLSGIEMGQRGELANIATEMQRRGYNAEQINQFIRTQAGLDADRNKTQYVTTAATNQGNAQNYLQSLLGMLGAPKNDLAVQGGPGAFFQSLISNLPAIIAGLG